MKKRTIKIQSLHPEAQVPRKANPSDACFDCWAVSKEDLGSNRFKYGLGFATQFDEDLRADFKPRSSVHETGMILANCTGTIDHLYRKQWFAIFFHVERSLPAYEVGDKIGQISFEEVTPVEFEVVKEVAQSERGGFGSTGKK